MDGSEELQALDQLTERLCVRFPQARVELVSDLVFRLHREYDGVPIRDFIPVLVERDAVETLRTLADDPGRQPAQRLLRD